MGGRRDDDFDCAWRMWNAVRKPRCNALATGDSVGTDDTNCDRPGRHDGTAAADHRRDDH
jgi:hypothetical protein